MAWRKGAAQLKAPAWLGEFFFPSRYFLIDLRPEFVRVGDSFPAKVVVVCGAGKTVFPTGDWFCKHSVWISTKRTLGEPKPLKTDKRR